MSLQILERPLEIAPLLQTEPISPPPETKRSNWRGAAALAIGGLAAAAALFYGAGETNPAPSGGDETTYLIPTPRSDDTATHLPIPTPRGDEFRESANPTITTLEPPTPVKNETADRTAAATSDRQVTTEKPPLPTRTRQDWPETSR